MRSWASKCKGIKLCYPLSGDISKIVAKMCWEDKGLNSRKKLDRVLKRFKTLIWGNKAYFEDDLRELLDIPRDAQCADLYCHTLRCKHLLIEKKGTDIRKADIQLAKTLKKLKKRGYKVDELVIIVKTMGNIYGVRRDKDKYLVIASTGDRYKINGILVRCFTIEEIRRKNSPIPKYYL